MEKFDYKCPLLTSLFGIGSIILLAARAYQSDLPDFWFGFMEGLGVVFIVVGTGYLSYCAMKRKNPLTFK